MTSSGLGLLFFLQYKQSQQQQCSRINTKYPVNNWSIKLYTYLLTYLLTNLLTYSINCIIFIIDAISRITSDAEDGSSVRQDIFILLSIDIHWIVCHLEPLRCPTIKSRLPCQSDTVMCGVDELEIIRNIGCTWKRPNRLSGRTR